MCRFRWSRHLSISGTRAELLSTETRGDSIVASLHLDGGGIGLLAVFGMFGGDASVSAVFAESMGPAVKHYHAVTEVDMRRRRGWGCCCGHTRRWWYNVGIVGAMVSCSLGCELADAFIILEVK
jgi:hypothetical protein